MNAFVPAVALFVIALSALAVSAQSEDPNCNADGTVCFSDDGDPGQGFTDPGATLDISGANDVTVFCLDHSDADTTSVTINTADHTGTSTMTDGC